MTAADTPMLELQHVDAAYGPFRALFDVSFTVPANAAVALVGPNGAGKTTVARVCSGLLAPTQGSVRLQGDDVTGLSPHELARRGVAHANEGRSVFASLSVEDNLTLSFRQTYGRSGVSDALEQAFDLFPRLRERRRQIAGSLSGGEQRMLALARVVVLKPAVLIADELSLGLAPIVIDEVYRALGRVRDGGTSVVLVEQHLERALDFADRAVAFDTGEVTWEGPSAELDSDRAAAFLGEPAQP
ncbi:MAG TPA: ABC transporter ATP-binding protein [Acidimicrobiales bacterium]|nr:ABC transporter ATP-binding protein [Acidimicrobiales bacterium]